MLLHQRFGDFTQADGAQVRLETPTPLNGFVGFSFQVLPVSDGAGEQKFFILLKDGKRVVAKTFAPCNQVASFRLERDSIHCCIEEPPPPGPEELCLVEPRQIDALDELRSLAEWRLTGAEFFVIDADMHDTISTADILPFSSILLSDGIFTVVRVRRAKVQPWEEYTGLHGNGATRYLPPEQCLHQVEYWRVAAASYAVVCSKKGAIWSVYVWSNICPQAIDEVIKILQQS